MRHHLQASLIHMNLHVYNTSTDRSRLQYLSELLAAIKTAQTTIPTGDTSNERKINNIINTINGRLLKS